MRISIETKVAGIPFEQRIEVSNFTLSQIDEDLIKEQITREILRAENRFLSEIFLRGIKAYEKNLTTPPCQP